MSRTRLRLVALAIVAFALVASSCFAIRGVKIVQQQRLGIGEIAKLQVDLYPLGEDSHTTGYAFVLVGLDDLTSPDNTRWDLLANYGGPIDARRNAVLRSLLLDGTDRCSSNGVSADDVEASYTTWIAIRTDSTIDSGMAGNGDALRIKIELERPGGTDDGGYGSFIVFSGVWADDGDGTAEDTDVFQCTGLVMSTIAFEASL